MWFMGKKRGLYMENSKEISFRKMTIDDCDRVYDLWLHTPGMQRISFEIVIPARLTEHCLKSFQR